jgi:hypothetical protein
MEFGKREVCSTPLLPQPPDQNTRSDFGEAATRLPKDNHQISSQNRQAMKVTSAKAATIPR